MAGRIAYYGGIVKDGLVLDLDAAKLDSYQGSGAVWRDLSGNNNNSQLLIATSSIGTGKETAISFPTGSAYLACISSTTLSTANNQFAWDPSGSLGSGYVTVEMWFKSNQTTFPATYLFAKPWNGNGDYNYSVNIKTTSSFDINARLASGFLGRTISNVPIIDGNWKQFVYWLSPTQHGYYVNGTQYSGSFSHTLSGSVPPVGNNQYPLTIMSLFPYPNVANPIFSVTGSVANVKFYNRVLTEREIVQNYNALKGRYGL